MRPRSRLLLATVAASLASVVLAHEADAQTTPPPATVSVAEAVQVKFAPLHWASGSVVSREDARVAGELEGRVVAVAEIGQKIAKGDALARLDDAVLRLRERDDQANVARIQAQLDYATSQEARYEQLAAQASIAGAQLDLARSERRVLEQELARARVALEQTRYQLSQSVVRAPFNGLVAERFIQLGEYLSTGAPVVRLVNTAKLEVRARAPVELAPQLAASTPVTLRIGEALSEQHVSALVPVADEASRQLELRIALKGAELPIGAAVEVGLPAAEARAVVAVPRDALVLRKDGSYVLRVSDESTAERVPVDAGAAQDGLVEVLGAVQPGDRLIVRGAERVQPGQRLQWPSLAAATATTTVR